MGLVVRLCELRSTLGRSRVRLSVSFFSLFFILNNGAMRILLLCPRGTISIHIHNIFNRFSGHVSSFLLA
jgi:hypothetical protein